MYWTRIEQKNWTKFNFIQPATTPGDLYVARASARCKINANVLLSSNSKQLPVYSLFHQPGREDLA